jgi:hypothetical protein
MSTVDWHTHEPEALGEAIPGVPLSVLEISEKVDPGEASPSTRLLLLSLSPPSSVSQRMAMILPAGPLLGCPDLPPTGFPLFVFELPVLLHFPLVSCLIIYTCSIRNANINKIHTYDSFNPAPTSYAKLPLPVS